MTKVFEYMKPYSPMILCIAALLFVEAFSALLLPGMMADIVNDGVLAGHTAIIWRIGGVMLLLTVAGVAASLTASYILAKTATGVANDLRQDIFQKVLSFSNAEVNKFSTSSLITRTTNDIMQVQSTMVMALRQLIYAPILGIGGVIRAYARDGTMMVVIAMATAVMIGILTIIFIIALPKFKMIQGLIDRLNLVSRENLSGILIVRAFNTHKFEEKRFDKANKDLAETSLFINKIMAIMMPSFMLILNLTTAVIVWFGAREASALRIDIGDIFAFMQYGMLIIFGFLMVAVMFIMLPRAVVSAGRIKDVLETEGSIKNKVDYTPLPKDFKGLVEFKNVSFRFPDATGDDADALSGISFTAKPGETTAIIGATGSGKSTLLKLLLRFYDVTGGAVCVDGIDIRDLKKTDLHDKIGYIPQKALLFTGTIRSNLMYAKKDATETEIEEAAEIAQAKAFIEAKEGGYDALIAQGGANLSGGQRQRLSIARALVKNAPIYLFDDSFSALDLKTDALLRAALKQKTGSSTMLIVAQRISTIMDANQIVVLEHGKVVGCGTHAELMQTCEVYREIAASQLSEEELSR